MRPAEGGERKQNPFTKASKSHARLFLCLLRICNHHPHQPRWCDRQTSCDCMLEQATAPFGARLFVFLGGLFLFFLFHLLLATCFTFSFFSFKASHNIAWNLPNHSFINHVIIIGVRNKNLQGLSGKLLDHLNILLKLRR